MGRLGRVGLAILLLGGFSSLQAQPSDSPHPQIPPDVLVPNAEAQAFFEVLRGQPLTRDLLAGLTAEQAAPVDTIIADMFRRGETVANWQRQGVNMRAILSALPGGADAHMSEATGRFGLSRVYPGDPPVETLIPRDWFLVGRYGERGDGGVVGIQIGRISPKVIMVARVGAEELGNASCTLHMQTFLYADPTVPASEMDTVATTMTMRMLPEFDRQPFCGIAEQSGPGVYLTRYFDREGRRLPAQDANSPSFRIVPRAPFR
jgi:hypothetical protein